MNDDVGYLNARVRALKGRLIGEAGIRRALEARTLEEFVSYIETTPYAAAVGEAMALRKGIAGVEEGLRRDFQHAIDHLVRTSGGRTRELLALVLGRWEIFNLKTVLRGRHAGAALEDVMGSTIPFGRLDEIGLQELSRQADVKGAIDLLSQWRIPYAGALRAAYPAYRSRGDFAVLETALDRGFFASALRRLDPNRPDDTVVEDCLRREIDLILLGYALRQAHHGVVGPDPREVFIPGGRTVTLPVFERLCRTENVARFLEEVPASSFGACLSAETRRYALSRRLSTLDRGLQSCFVREMTRLLLRDPLSIAFTIGYLWRKVGEIVNLRLIARGTHVAIPREQIEALLLAPGQPACAPAG